MTNPEIVFHPLIIPTVVVPFALVLAGLSAIATFIAGLFGLTLKAEGPKKLLEVLLKPRVLFVALVMNLALLGGWKLYGFWKNSPVMLWKIEREQRALARPSTLEYPNEDEEKLTRESSEGKAIEVAVFDPGKEFTDVEPVWTRELGAGSFRGALVVGSSIFVGTNDGRVHEVYPSNGEIRRSFFVGTPVSSGVSVHDGHLYAAEGVHDTRGARVYKFDLKSGNFVSSYSSDGHIEGRPTIARHASGDLVIVPSGRDGLAAIDARTMSKIWHVNEGHVDAAARTYNGVVFAATGLEKENPAGSKGLAFAFELTTGRRLWRNELPASSWMRPITWRDKVCFIFGEVYFPSGLGGFYCFRQSDGRPDVAYNHGSPIAAEPIVVQDDLVVSDLNGNICRVSLESGRERWCRATGAAKKAFPNPRWDERRGVLVYPSESSGLFVLDPSTGKVLVQWKAEGEKLPWGKTLAPAAILNDGWIIVDSKGVMRKLRPREKATIAMLNRSADR